MPRAVIRGEPHSVRSTRPRCRFPPACAGLPDRDTESTAPPRMACAARVANLQWGLTCTGLWTERRTCPRMFQRRFLGACLARVRALVFATLTTFPSSATRGHLLSSVRSRAWERAPSTRDGPTKTHVPPSAREGCRHPMDQDAFHRCDRGYVKGLRLSVFRVGLPLTPPTRRSHGWDRSAFRGALQAPLPGDEPAVTSREQVAFVTSLVRSHSRARAWA
jgi:hypothetical protein